ncbi:39730_t:CDS:2, partial [Gigaspora margarita]
MNNFNTSHLKDVITATLQEILVEDPNFFTGQPLTSNSGQSGKESLEIQPNNSLNQRIESELSQTDAIAKFQQRQEQAKNYGKPSIQELSTSLKTIAPQNSETTQIITYVL